MNKLLLTLSSILLVIAVACAEESNNPIEPLENGRTITLDANNDCNVLLDNLTTIISDLQGGQNYTVSVSSNVSGTWMKGAFFVYSNSDGSVSYRYVDNGGSFSFKPYISGRQLAPFLVDWDNISDNSGIVTINITGPTSKIITLDAKNDCNILLDNVTTIISDLQGGQNYTVSVSSNVSGTWMKGAFFIYSNSDGSVSYRYIDNGESFTFSPFSSGRQLAPLLVDWGTISDNNGTVTIEIQ